MNLTETAAYLKALSHHDDLIQTTEENARIWQSALAKLTAHEVWAATVKFSEMNENVKFSPAAIRRMAYAARERAVAVQTALTAAPRPRSTALSWRERTPEEWDRLFEAGRQSWRQQHGLA